MKRLALVILSLICLTGAAKVPTPKEQSEGLLDSILPFAEKMLKDHGEFHPFGATLKSDGTSAMVASSDGTEKPKSQPLIDLIRNGFKSSAAKHEIIASALAYDVRVTPPGSSSKTDAVAVELDHRDNYSVVVYFPYFIRSGAVVFGEAFASAGARSIFPVGG
jgi:hypothetical protein